MTQIPLADARPNSPSAAPDRLLDLLEHWQALGRQGQTVSAAKVCGDCLELAGDLERVARFARKKEDFAAASAELLGRLPPHRRPELTTTGHASGQRRTRFLGK